MAGALSRQTQAALTRRLSDNRTRFWGDLANGDFEEGLQLHKRNALIAGTLLMDMQIFEVALRNAFDEELQKHYPGDWLYTNDFSQRSNKAIEKAKSDARRQWRREGHLDQPPRDKVFIQLTFGFWVALFASSKVQDKLAQAFGTANTSEMLKILRTLRNLRNELVHHEPVITWDGQTRAEDLTTIMEDMDKALRAICPLTAEWAERHSYARPLIGAKLHIIEKRNEYKIEFAVP